jgi:SAM-dependent methyltransferase
MGQVSDTIIRQIESNCRLYYKGVLPENFDYNALARDVVNEKRAVEELERLSDVISMPLENKTILEIGSGYGMVLALARKKFGAFSYGLEPSEQFVGSYETGMSLLEEMGVAEKIVRQGFAESIPYENEYFDIVYSSNVLEHVKDLSRAFEESIRVVKRGGFIVAVIPNYGSWWEGHYGIVVPPYSSKSLLKTIVKLLGRDPSFVDTLQLITYKKLKTVLEKYDNKIEIIDWGRNLWETRLKSLSFSEWGQLSRLKRILAPIKALGLIRIIIWLGKIFHWETPFVLVIRKK